MSLTRQNRSDVGLLMTPDSDPPDLTHSMILTPWQFDLLCDPGWVEGGWAMRLRQP